MEIGGDGNGSGDGESQPSSSDSGQVLALSKRIMEEVLRSGGGEGKTIIIAIVQQGNGGVAEDVRLVELQSSEDNLLAGGTQKKALQLKFFGEVPDTVRTGTVLTSKTGECFKLVLVNSETGDTVDCVPESSAEAEIVALLDGKNDMTRENFERRIIKTGEKKKPHFVKRVYINLKEGVGYLRDVKLGQESDWTKKCKCRLGARVGQSLYAWTQPFEIIDKRDKDNEKHFPPKLSSEVWRLVRICRDGKPCKRLTGKNIETLGDFLFWFHVNRQGLKRTEARELVVSAFADRAGIVSFDDSAPNFATSSSLSIVQSSSNLLCETSFHGDLSSEKIGGSSYLQENASSPDYMDSVYSAGGLSTFEDSLHRVGNSLISNIDTFNQAFCTDGLQYFKTDSSVPNSPLQLSDDIQGEISAYIPYSDFPTDKAQRGWKILVCVLRWWFSIRRIVARKTHA